MTTPGVYILRIATGEDIVGEVEDCGNIYQITSPFKVIFRRFTMGPIGLLVVPWLPDELLEESVVSLLKTEVLCFLNPKKEFVDYYHRVADNSKMRLIEHDMIYRDQLLSLDKIPTFKNIVPTKDQFANFGFSSYDEDKEQEDEQEGESEDEDDGPTFH